MKLIKRGRYWILIFLIWGIFCSLDQWTYVNEGTSKSKGSVRDGSVSNAWLMPWSGKNFGYFSWWSYFVIDNAYIHSDVYKIALEAYETCETTCPNTFFRTMECGNTNGGKMTFHNTHQNGLGIDFMIPKLNSEGVQTQWLDRIGMWHYLLEFDTYGKNQIFGSIQLDLETMAKHILALDDAAKKRNMSIHKIILRTELLDDFFNTPSGKKVKERGIYFMPRLYPLANKVHDDHYHVDFKKAFVVKKRTSRELFK